MYSEMSLINTRLPSRPQSLRVACSDYETLRIPWEFGCEPPGWLEDRFAGGLLDAGGLAIKRDKRAETIC